MKIVAKTAALAAALAAAGVAHSAQVELFGFLDAGVSYINEHTNAGMAAPVGQKSANTVDKNGYVSRNAKRQSFEQGTGNVSTFGFRGKEELTDDVSVTFHLEQGFLADTGEFYNRSKMFERESTVGLVSKTWGEFKVGRMPGILTGSGTTGKLNGRVNPFGAGWGNMTGGYKFVSGLQVVRLDNMFYYATPKMGGFNGYLQGSFGNTSEGSYENTSKSDRYLAGLVSYENGPLFAALGVDWMNMTSSPKQTYKDWYRVYAGAHYDFSGFTLYGTAHYMKNVQYIGGYSTKEFAPLAYGQKHGTDMNKGFEGYAVTTGAKFGLWGGTVMTSVGYGWGEDQNLETQNKYKRANAGLGYRYPLSKRTSLYGIAGVFWQDADWQKKNIYANELILGLMHRF
jgi:predicted porin